MATWSAVSCLPLFLGGMCKSGSSLSIRRISSLSSGLPGTIASAIALQLGKRPFLGVEPQPAFRRLSSGPWQAKQLSERIGRTSRAKLTGRGLALPVDATLSPWPCAVPAVPRINTNNPIRKQSAIPSPPCVGQIPPRTKGKA